MIRTLSYTAILFFGISLLGSCETTEKIDDFPLRPAKLVANCYFTTDSTWNIQVSKSLSVLDNAELKYVDDAKVYLMHSGNIVDSILEPDSDGIYRSAVSTPVPGESYAIEVHSPDFKNPIYAEDIMPIPVQINTVSLQIIDSTFYRDPFSDEAWGELQGTLSITIKDPAAQENYYELSVFSYYEYYDYYDSTIYVERFKIGFTSNDPLVETTDDYNTTLYFTDEILDGQKYTLDLDFEDWNANTSSTYEVELSSLSRAAYLYRRSIDEYEQAADDPFSEPVVIYSNVENGFGIFAGYSYNRNLISLFR